MNIPDWQAKETEAFAKTLKVNQNTGNCPKCGLNIDLDIAMYNCGKVICDGCFLKEQELKRLKSATQGWVYPLNVSFHLQRSKYGTQSISFVPVKNKSKLENLKFDSIRLLPLNGSRMAVIAVECIESVEQLKEYIDDLSEFWCVERSVQIEDKFSE